MDNGEPQQNDGAEEELTQEQTEKLLHFQEITNNDDLEHCKRIMRSHDFNVEMAVQSTLSGFSEGPPPRPTTTSATSISSNVRNNLRRRNVASHLMPLPVMNARLYESRRSARWNQPQGFFGWSYYFLSLPFRWTWITFSGVVKFFIRLFITEPRMAIVNPLRDVQDFIREYEESYGTNHPRFNQGTYSDAQADARRLLRFLLVYLHDPNHTDTEDFCQNTLANSDVIELVERNFVFWSCSVLKPEGYRVSKAMRENNHPFLAVICLMQGKLTIVGRLEGALTPQEFLEHVSGLVEHFEPMLDEARADKAEREMTQMLRHEQDAAYEQSLLEDKVKEEKKKKDEEIRIMKEEELARKRRKKEEEEKSYLRRKMSCKNMLSEEPESSHPDVMKLLIKLPDGSRLTRNFLSTQPIRAIHDFIYCHDSAPRRFQVTTNFPKRKIPGCSTTEILAAEEKTFNHCDSTSNVEKSNLDKECELSISTTGLRNSEMLFVQAIDDSDEEDS